MKKYKVFFIIFALLISFCKGSLDDCTQVDSLTCAKLNIDDHGDPTISEEFDIYGFQTPPRNDALGNYKSTFQDYRYFLGYAETKYTSKDLTSCEVEFKTRVNPDLGTEGEDYSILYTFGDKDEQEFNRISLNSEKDSYPNGMAVSARIINAKTGTETVSLTLPDLYFYWDNTEINTPEEYRNGQRGTIVELFGWPMEDVGEECEFMGIAGYLGVKVYSSNEHLLSDTLTEGSVLNPWWYNTQTISFKIAGRSGNHNKFKKMVNRCRENNVRVYVEVVINHTTGGGNDYNVDHIYKGEDTCSHWGPKGSSGGSPCYNPVNQYEENYYTNKLPGIEYPGIPFLPSDFHCEKGTDETDMFLLTTGHFFGMQDVNTEKESVQKRIATFFVDYLSMGVSGITIANGEYMFSTSIAKILGFMRSFLCDKLPDDFIFIIILESMSTLKGYLFCPDPDEEEPVTYVNYASVFTQALKNEKFTDADVLKVKFWFKGSLSTHDRDDIVEFGPICDNDGEMELAIDVSRWTVSLEYSDDINRSAAYVIYIRDMDIEQHRNILINWMYKDPLYNWSIRNIFTSYSLGEENGFPDGMSEKTWCSTQSCRDSTVDIPFKRAYLPNSEGYDCGVKADWKTFEFSRVHRDKEIINAMRAWLYSKDDVALNDTQLYAKERKKAECAEKCLICNAESKKLGKCLFCDSNNDYYPVMETNGAEQYYECYKKDQRVEGLYFSAKYKAFLPCYESCKYCDEEGDINDHKCLECGNNLIKKPDTKASATTFNCITKCAQSYYYTESGQYKCTSGTVCPQDRSIYIKDLSKCVSTCKGEDPYIYLYEGECLSECPRLITTPDTENNICRINNSTYCQLTAKSDSNDSPYNQNMFNSYAKAYQDEFLSYTDKHVTKIIGATFNIYIYKDLSCINTLGLSIPNINDLRLLQEEVEETTVVKVNQCYKTIQESENIDDSLIVLLFEDTSKTVVERGYLFYHPETGIKIDYETICGNLVDIKTVEDESNSGTFSYIYIILYFFKN